MSHVVWRQISVEFVKGQNRVIRFQMVAILFIKNTICLESRIIFKNLSYQTKAGNQLHNFGLFSLFIDLLEENGSQLRNFNVAYLYEFVK